MIKDARGSFGIHVKLYEGGYLVCHGFYVAIGLVCSARNVRNDLMLLLGES